MDWVVVMVRLSRAMILAVLALFLPLPSTVGRLIFHIKGAELDILKD
jgi:hypothetical protein